MTSPRCLQCGLPLALPGVSDSAPVASPRPLDLSGLMFLIAIVFMFATPKPSEERHD